MNLWDRILSSLQQKINVHSFNTWLRPTQQLSAAGGTLQVEVPSSLFLDWINKNYLSLIEESARELDLGALRINFTSRQAGSGSLPQSFVTVGTDAPAPSRTPAFPADLSRRPQAGNGPQARSAPPASPPSGLSTRYTFETFVVSSCNQFACAAALAVTERPSDAYNPLYIYGGVGLGKTHLMHAIGNRITRDLPGLRQRYISAEAFMNELIHSIRFDRTIDFKEHFRNVDVLLIDDIQFLAGKERTQEEFFHTFNALYESQKQIVMTSDCPPRDIPTLEERLSSRFEWGLISDIQPPDLETKVAILTKKAEAMNLRIPEDVALFICGRIRSNIRELEGSLIRLIAHNSVNARPIDLETAREVLKDLFDDRGRAITIEAIQKFIAGYYSIKVADIKARNNSRHVAFPRQVAMYLCKHLTNKSLPAIGAQFGGKHHTTVLHGIRKIEAMRARDKDFDRIINSLKGSFT